MAAFNETLVLAKKQVAKTQEPVLIYAERVNNRWFWRLTDPECPKGHYQTCITLEDV